MFHYQSPNKEVYVSAGVHLLVCLQSIVIDFDEIFRKLTIARGTQDYQNLVIIPINFWIQEFFKGFWYYCIVE